MPRPTLSRHYLDQIDEDHFQLEQLFRAVKTIQARLYAVEASQRSVLSELDDLVIGHSPHRQITYEARAIRQHDRPGRKPRQS